MGGATFYFWGYVLCALLVCALFALAGCLWWLGRRSNPVGSVRKREPTAASEDSSGASEEDVGSGAP